MRVELALFGLLEFGTDCVFPYRLAIVLKEVKFGERAYLPIPHPSSTSFVSRW